MLLQRAAFGDRDGRAERIKHVDAWQHIGRCIRLVNISYKIYKYVVTGKCIRTQILRVWKDGTYDQEDRHAGTQKCGEAIESSFVREEEVC